MTPARSLRSTLKDVPGLRHALRGARGAWWAVKNPMAYPPGHFYSPLPSLADVRDGASAIFDIPPAIPGLDLRAPAQLDLVRELRRYHDDQPFPPHPMAGMRYHFENPFFGYGDGIVAHCMLRHLAPRRVIEVGSGYSSALILDTNDRFLDGRAQCTLVEPHPDRLRSLVGDPAGAGVRMIESRVQDVDVALFEELEAGDILFVDSTHVAKVGSDVNLLLLEVLPALQPGVVVHIHDISYPFEYPRDWIEDGVSWNEAYMLRAFLLFNHEFEILLFNSFLAAMHREEVAKALPLWGRDPGSSIWIRRTGTT